MPLVVPAPGAPLPARMRVKMRAQGQSYFTSASPQAKSWSLNNATAPLGSAASIGVNQHRGWDQISTLYQRCQVIAFRVIIDAMNVSGTETMMIGFAVSAGTFTLDNDCRRLSELPFSRVVILPVLQATPKRLILAATVQDVYAGGLAGRYLPEEFSTLTIGTSNPSRSIYMNLYGNVLDGSGTNGIRFSIIVEQIIDFYDPTPVVPSV